MTEGKDRTLVQKAQERLSAMTDALTGQPHFNFPPFDALPKIEGQPQGCTWGLFDKDGVKDQIGTINLLTPEVVKQASQEIKTGQHVQLDWCLTDGVQFPGFGRRKFEQKVIDFRTLTDGKQIVLDDELHFNTQGGSQWDSLKHCAHQKTGMHYNGLSHDEALRTDKNGIHNWCERGGIVGRGVLVDWLSWYEKKYGDPPSPVTTHAIPIDQIEECLRWQGTTLKPADILIVRSGYTRWHNYANPEERKKGTQDNANAIGVKADEHSVRWFYDHHFAAVAGDTVAFESWPPNIEAGWALHEWLLVQFGTPIGELWDLETLSKVCEQQKRWSFFLTSAPLHVRGGVGSPPGVIAIF